jgi:iron complex outermembrane receptor protein
VLAGNPNFKPEEVIGVEGGYRFVPAAHIFFDFATFYNSYDSLISLEAPIAPGEPPTIGNTINATTAGGTVAFNYEPFSWIRSAGSVTFFHKDISLDPNSRDISNASGAGNDPDYYWNLQFMFDPIKNVQADVIFRASDELPTPIVPGYVTMDLRLGWYATESIELSITGRNLLQPSHPEFGAPTPLRREVERSVYGKITWFF